MITTRSRETYDGSWRIVLYDADDGGRCAGTLGRSSFDAEIDDYYVQRAKELSRLQERVWAGEASPLALFMELSRMTVDDAAARMRLRKSQVRDHMTPAGFDKIPVATLRGYASLFDIAVADFFDFIHLDGAFAAEVTRSEGGLVQRVRIAPRAERG